MAIIIRYNKPIIKTAAEMKPGDIFRTEYGDYGNWCEFVFESCNAHLFDATETHFHRKGHTQSETCYSMTNIRKVVYEVVGRESV